MQKETLGYSLVQGYIHHWLVAGPQAIPVEELRRFGNPPDKLQIARQYNEPGPGIEGRPIEYGDYKLGGDPGKWRYVRTRHDHLIDLSAFYPSACFLRAWAYTEIESPAEQEITFILTSHGPADLWINDIHAYRQEHFQPQIPKSVPLKTQLLRGMNQLMVRFEQVALRETPYSLALQLVGFEAGAADRGAVRIPTCASDPRYRLRLETLFEDCSLRQDVYTRKDEIVAYLPEGKAAATPFNIRMQTLGGSIYAEATRNGQRTEPRQPMGLPLQSPEGSYQLRFLPPPQQFYERNIRITRTRDFYACTNLYSTRPYGTYPERRIECLKDAAHRRDNLFGEIAKMEGGWWNDVNEKAILKAVEDVDQRCAGSVIQLCGLLSMLYRYADMTSFPAALCQPLEGCVLGFRYGKDETGSDSMDFQSESQSILFYTCEVLAGQHYRERVFPNSGQSGQWHLEQGERLVLEWLQQRAANGFEEWDSNFEEVVLALSTLASLAENPQVYEMATLVLDKMFFGLAVNSFQGVFGSTKGRTKTSQIKTGYREATAGISRLLWGMGIFNEHIPGSVSLACSTYEVPEILADIAVDQPAELWSKEQQAGVNKVTYKTPDGMLSSTQDWRPGEPGCQERVWQATLSPLVTVFTSHPACASETDSHRPNYWLGNAALPRLAQWKDTLIAIYNFAEEDWMGFTHAYFPVHGMDEYEIRDTWAFGKAGNGYLALAAARGLEFQASGDNAYRELRSPGTPNLWLCQIGRAALDGSFKEFIEKVSALSVVFEGKRADLRTLRGDRLQFGWEEPLLINGEPLPLENFRHHDNPYCTYEAGAPMMEIRHRENILRLHWKETG